jgi:FkbM family methyltransferase
LVKNTSKFSIETPIVYLNKAISNGEDVKVFSGNENVYGGVDDFECLSFSNFIRDYDISEIDFLKMDIEGVEYEILPEMLKRKQLQRLEELRVEYHSTKFNSILAETHAKISRDVLANTKRVILWK